ncbi:SUN domain-containing protein 3 [Mucor circinelloides]
MDDFSTNSTNRSIPEVNVPLDTSVSGDEMNDNQDQQQPEGIESTWKDILTRIMVVPSLVTLLELKLEHFESLKSYTLQWLSSTIYFAQEYSAELALMTAWTCIINGLRLMSPQRKPWLLLWVFIPLTTLLSIMYPIYLSSQSRNALYISQAPTKQYSSFAKHLVDIDTKITEQASRMEQLFQKTQYSNKLLLEQMTFISSQIREQQSQLNYQREDYRRIWDALYTQNQYMLSVSDDIKMDVIEALQDNTIVVFDKSNEQLKVSPQFLEYMQTANFIQAFIQHNRQTIRSFIQQELHHFFLSQKDESRSIMEKIEQVPASLEQLVETMIKKYQPQHEDEPDFALGSRGGRIITSKTSKTYRAPPTSKLFLRRALGYYPKITKPAAVLQPGMQVGECWSMSGTNGTVGIYLSKEIYMTSVTIEHPSASVLLDDIKNAPQDFRVFGMPTDSPDLPDEPLLLGQFKYDIHSEQKAQKFPLETDRPFHTVIIQFLSNWGNADFTDIYRIKVSGKPVSPYVVDQE